MPLEKQEPPGGGGSHKDPAQAWAAARSKHTPAPAHSQAAPAQAEIFVEHSQHAAVSVGLSRDRGRVTISCFAKVDGAWRAVGPAPSFPAIVLDSAIDALQALRAKMERGR